MVGALHVLADVVVPYSGSGSTLEWAAIRTKSEPGTRIIFDFGNHRRVSLDAYLLQHGHEQEHAALRSWAVEGSNDLEQWYTVDRQESNECLGRQPFNVVVFPIAADHPYEVLAEKRNIHRTTPVSKELVASERAQFRFISVRITGPNAAGEDMFHIELSRVEFFGSIHVI
jgi:hypothetical protein